MAALKFDVSHFPSCVDEAPSDFSRSGDAHRSADSVCLTVLCLLDRSDEVILVVGDANRGS